MFPEVTPSNNEIDLRKACMDPQASCVINEDFTEISPLPMSRRSFSVWRDYQAVFECTDFIKDRKISQTRKCTSLEYKVNEIGRASRDKRNIYYREAKEEGWHARTPGSWSQPMAPIEGVIQVQGDIINVITAKVVIKHFDECKADLVICDAVPDVTGLHDMDEFIQSRLILAGLTIVTHVLREVTSAKPKSSQISSIEAFAVCENYSPPEGFNLKDLHHLLEKVGTPSEADDLECSSGWLEGPNKVFIPILACGDLSGYDSDHSYPLPTIVERCSYQSLDPVQPPIAPPYYRALEMKKARLGGDIIMLFHNDANYVVFINTAQEFEGSDSGARPDEAVSWGKIRGSAETDKVHCDATVAFPLLRQHLLRMQIN
ncbi:hypothetical protein GIB67_031750 [Kingdonia uniflora]|uniref:Ribosomal RNA methyltransferase FtsJ domain-containing protein n=1 Tax=Kingdonia uniflora TaxID=39325 RepID=A0A7J7NJZ3_9MAGN|nr:hypothetical protein GIB67_031750 [Kingdonia uniflora]